MYRLVSAMVLWMFPAGSAAAADGPADRFWPVGQRPAVVRGWEPPPSPYTAGHRGVDLAAVAGQEVRAAAAGRVSFAGRVAGRGVLSITLSGTGDPPLRTTYEPVRALVAKDADVVAGQVVAVLEPGTYHCPASGCLHWGLLRHETYLNPLSLLPPGLLHRSPPRLLPVFGVPPPASAPKQGAPRVTGAAALTPHGPLTGFAAVAHLLRRRCTQPAPGHPPGRPLSPAPRAEPSTPRSRR
ncbi:M23 family metallopeptidase [Streptomyces sp. NPDC051561]|uniref:M23 family metallopeptidase n=1 Tax=Streptomyces sp. NPDC051561 TaxID=3365658 RepID=UPI0037B78B98